MKVHQIEILPTAPYCFETALAYLCSSPSTVLEQIISNNTYLRAVTVAGNHLLISLRSIGTIDQPRLTLEVFGYNINETTVIQIAQHIRQIFSLDADHRQFEMLGAREPVLNMLIRQFRGLRPILIADSYEALLWAIIGQQVNVSFARKLKLRLVEICGNHLQINGREYLIMPHPEDVAALDEKVLRAHQFSQRKASYLIDLSRAVANGHLNLQALGSLSYEEAVSALTRFNGIGNWTAEYVLMRGLGMQDVVPAGDLGLRRVIGQAYGLGQTATEVQVRLIAEQYAGWRSWFAFYWWFALQQATIPNTRPVSQKERN